MISELFLTAATPGVVEPAAEVEVVAPESWSEDEDEPTAATIEDEAAESGLRRQ